MRLLVALVLVALLFLAGCKLMEQRGEDVEGVLEAAARIAANVVPAPFGSLVAVVMTGAATAVGNYARRKRREAIEEGELADAALSAIQAERDDGRRRELKRRTRERAGSRGLAAKLDARGAKIKAAAS